MKGKMLNKIHIIATITKIWHVVDYFVLNFGIRFWGIFTLYLVIDAAVSLLKNK